jgi:polysaccharide pyruvyl transferase WcaK-like protein
MATKHDVLLTDHVLRPLASIHGEPSEALGNYVKWLLPANRVTVEFGLSTLSLLLGQRSALHSCVLPDAASKERLATLLTRHGIESPALQLVSGGLGALADFPDGSADAVILSCTPAFPAYYAWCHEALRMLRLGGRLIIRGAGIWTIEQFKNHLRLDPRFKGYLSLIPDATVVQKAAETQDVAWSQQPYVMVNSLLVQDQVITAAQALPVYAGMQSFSTAIDAAQAARAQRARTTARVPNVGLVGYYGFGNYGDELFRIGFEQSLPDFHLPLFADMPRRPFILGSRVDRVKEMDAILIGGGDLVIPRFREWYFSEEYLKRPVFIHGVGVPHAGASGDPKVVDFLKCFFRNPNVRWINTRDAESAEWIREHLQPDCPVDLSPDIVCGLDFPQRSILGDVRTIALVTRKTGGGHENFAPMREFVHRARARGITVRAVIAGAGLIAEDDFQDFITRGLAVNDVIRCRTMEEVTDAITSADMVVSMKFHGCVAGLMAGLPTVSLLRDDKFTNLYRALGLETMIMAFNAPQVADILDIPRVRVNQAKLTELREGARAAMARLRDAMTQELLP